MCYQCGACSWQHSFSVDDSIDEAEASPTKFYIRR